MDNETYNKIKEEIKRIQEQFHQIARDVDGNFEEGQKPFGIILMNGDNEGCTTQVLSTPKIAAMMILQLLNNRPEIAQEIKRIQAIAKLERLASFIDAILPDDDKDEDEEDEKCFDVFVTDTNGNNSKLARYIAKNFDFSLKEAADIVKSIPCTIVTNLSKEMAKMIQKTIEGLGCNVAIIPTKTKMV